MKNRKTETFDLVMATIIAAMFGFLIGRLFEGDIAIFIGIFTGTFVFMATPITLDGIIFKNLDQTLWGITISLLFIPIFIILILIGDGTHISKKCLIICMSTSAAGVITFFVSIILNKMSSKRKAADLVSKSDSNKN